MNYVLFADSDSDMTPKIAEKYGYNIISMPFSIGETTYYPYENYNDFNPHEFNDELRKGLIPKTSSVSPEKYVEYFEPFFKAGKDILYVHFSAELSSTFNAMEIAVASLKEKYPDRRFETIDTKGITILSLNILYEVGDLYLQGKTIDEIIEWAKDGIMKFAVYLFVEDMTFFKRSGRVSGFSATMGNLLNIRPIIYVNKEGKMLAIDKCQGTRTTIKRIINYMIDEQEDIEKHRIIIGHTDNKAVADTLCEAIKAEFGENLNIEYVDVNPTACCHCGPDGVAVSFHIKERK